MKAVFIDSNTDFTKAVVAKLELPDENTATLSEDVATAEDVRALAESIVSKHEDAIASQSYSELLFFINIDLVLNKSYNPFLGVELLTWLRIKGMMSHCVMYSFCDASTIAGKDRQNLILFSKGTTFIHLPYDFSQLESKIANLSTEVATNNNLESYLKASFNLGAFRHREANWWGLKQLWDVHRAATLGEFKEEFPSKIAEQFEQLNGTVADFLFGAKTARDIVDIITGLKSPPSQPKRKGQIVASAEQLKKILGLANTAANVTQSIDTSIDSDQKGGNNPYQDYQKAVHAWTRFKKISNQSKGLLVIDDQFAMGWEKIYGAMFGHIANVRSIANVFDYKDRSQELIKIIKEEILSNSPDAILLDLRLFDEEGDAIPVETLSGYLVLMELRKTFPSIPVLITTASNKFASFHALTKLGADAYWMKEGLDLQYDEFQSVHNYCELLRLVRALLDGKYEILRKLGDLANWVKSNPIHWSQNITWANGARTPGAVDKDKLEQTLYESVNILKEYMHDSHLAYSFSDDSNDKFVLSGLINKIGGVYEVVHGITSDEDYKKSKDTIIQIRGDMRTENIRLLRNKNSHSTFNGEWEDLEKMVDLVDEYLRNPFSFATEEVSIDSVGFTKENGYHKVILNLSNKITYDIGKLDLKRIEDSNNIVDNETISFYMVNQLPFIPAQTRTSLLEKLRRSLGGRKIVDFNATTYDEDTNELVLHVDDGRGMELRLSLSPENPIVQNLCRLKGMNLKIPVSVKPGGNICSQCLYGGTLPRLSEDIV